MRKFQCSICGYVYDETVGIFEKSILPKTKWENIIEDFACPVCTAPKSVFKLFEKTETKSIINVDNPVAPSLKKLSAGEISVICSNLAKGCDKQRLAEETTAFNKIAEYFKLKAAIDKEKTLTDAAAMLGDDFANRFGAANVAAKANMDRGAMRSLVWSEKVSTMMKTLLDRFAKEGDAMLENTKIFVCDICGFICIGDMPPEVCPVCKVPNFKINQVERR